MKRKFQTLASILAIGLFVFLAFGSDDEDTSTETTTNSQTTTSTDTSEEPEEIENWSYSEQEDEMSGNKMYFATTRSTNRLDFEFPYNGGSYFDLIIRNMGKGNEVILKVSKGQFMTSISSSENVRVKFDDGELGNYSFNSAADGSSDVIFLNNSDWFIKQLKKANKLKIEAPFFNEGRQVIKFDVEGLEWKK